MKRALFALVATVIAVIGLELAAWGWEHFTYLGGDIGHSPELYLDTNGGRPQLKPGARLEGGKYQISINSLGFRGEELQERKPQNGLRVWCIGGSTTFDIYAPTDADTWPAQLQEILSERLPDRQVEVINAGIPGEVLSGSRIDFDSFYGRVLPDVLVVYHGPNDMRFATSSAGLPMAEPSPLMRMALFRVLSRWIPVQTVREEWKSHQIDDGQWSRIRRDINGFLESSSQKGIEVVMASHAHRAPDGATGFSARVGVGEGTTLLQMSPEGVIAAFDHYNDMVRGMAESRGLAFADVRGAVPPSSRYFGDHTHFTEAGSRLAAEEVANAVMESLGL